LCSEGRIKYSLLLVVSVIKRYPNVPEHELERCIWALTKVYAHFLAFDTTDFGPFCEEFRRRSTFRVPTVWTGGGEKCWFLEAEYNFVVGNHLCPVGAVFTSLEPRNLWFWHVDY